MDILVFLSEDGIGVIERQGQTESHNGLKFDWTSVEDFEAYLKSLPNDFVIAIMLDYIDEAIKTDWYPKLLPWEKPALEKRQVQKVYSDGAAFVNFIWNANFRTNDQGREEQEARISSISKSEALSQLFDFFSKQKLVVKSIYSITFLIEGYFAVNIRKAAKLPVKQLKHPVLVFFRESKFVFRQVLLNEGTVRLTRLIEVDNNLENDVAIMYALIDEASLIVKYIYNQKYLEYNAQIGMVYLDNDDASREMFVGLYREKIVLSSWNSKSLVLSATTYLSTTNKKMTSDSSLLFREAIADYVFLRKPASFYQNVLTQKISQLLASNLILTLLAVITFSVGAYYNGRLWIDTQVVSDSTQSLSLKVAQYRQEIKKIEETIKIKFDAEDIKQIVDFSNNVIKSKTEKRLGFDLLAFSEQVLEKYPMAQLTKIDWKQVGTLDSQALQVVLEGELGPFQGLFKPTIEDLEAFLEAIRAFPNVKNVSLLRTPLELSLSKSFSISMSQPVERLPFSLSFEVDYVVTP